jgi:hypothetical protein
LRRLIATCVVAAGFVVLGCGFAVGNTVATPGPGTPALARLGFVVPVAQNLIYQSDLEHYADLVQRGVAEAAAVSVVPLPGDRGKDVANAETCKQMHLAGFVKPQRQWEFNRATFTVNALLAVTDCDGNPFYRGTSVRTDRRNQNLQPLDQLAQVQMVAIEALIKNFQDYKLAHEAAWDALIGTASLHTPIPVYNPRTTDGSVPGTNPH